MNERIFIVAFFVIEIVICIIMVVITVRKERRRVRMERKGEEWTKTKTQIEKEIDDWFASPEYKAIRIWQTNQGEMLDKVGELTKECNNDYDVILYYNTEKDWFRGNCFYCCEFWGQCKKGKRKELFKQNKEE